MSDSERVEELYALLREFGVNTDLLQTYNLSADELEGLYLGIKKLGQNAMRAKKDQS